MSKKKLFLITDEDKTGIQLALELKNDDEKTICLMQDAVFFANKQTKEIGEALNQKLKVIACKEDVDRRGIQKYIFNEIVLKDYAEIVETIIENDQIINC
jgi:sulfur relay protein TusB/DsrH